MRVLVTGASGFVGSALLRTLGLDPRRQIVAAMRDEATSRQSMSSAPVSRLVAVGDIGSETDWRPALSGVDAVVHLAARVHVMRDTVLDPWAQFHRVNVDATLNLARQAAAAGARRFVFLSSVKVNGECTPPGRPFQSSDRGAPLDPYGASKQQAELALQALAAGGGMSVVSIRPPLIYGPGVRANFLRLLATVERGIPLPLGGVSNSRSLVSVWNLCDLIRAAIDAPALQASVLMVSDGEDLSTPQLIRRVAGFMDRPARLYTLPLPLLRAIGRLAGKAEQVSRLCDSLTVDISPTRRELDWSPPVSVDDSLQATVQWYLRQRQAATGAPAA